MPAFTPPLTIDRPDSGQGGGVHPPGFGGGDDYSPGDGSPDYGRRLQKARLALVLGLVSVCIIFVFLTLISIVLHRGAFVLDSRTGAYVREWVRVALPFRLLLINTSVLLISSFTMEMSRRAIAREMALAPIRSIPGIRFDTGLGVPWLAVTIVLGIMFLVGQGLAWLSLQAHGFPVSAHKPTPFFYLLTGAHAVHLAAGIIGLLYAGVVSLFRYSILHRRIVIEVASWYWHFMGILWLYVFALLEFAM